jgi:hypothetical protein
MKFEAIISSILKTILVIAGICLFFISFVSLKKQQLKNEAVSECLKYSGTYEFNDIANNIKSIAPQKEIYAICLTDKGYSSTWK